MISPPPFVPQDVCLSCDGCCRFKEHDSSWRPRLASEEIRDACAGHNKLAEDIFSKNIDETGRVKTVLCQNRHQCAFLHAEDNLCHIYEHRPFECRLYPFLIVKKQEGAFIGVHLSCPYIQAKYHGKEFDAYVGKLKKYFQKPGVMTFVQNNPSMCADYSQYQNEIAIVFALDQ